MKASQPAGPLQISLPRSPKGNYEVECSRCRWMCYGRDPECLAELLRTHIDQEHINPRSLEEMLATFDRPWHGT